MSEVKNQENDILNKTVEEGGSYGLIKKRLINEGELLQEKIEKLNNERQEEFGGTKSEIIGKVNVRTDNNCVPIDMASIGEHVIFGYDVFLGMKTEVKIEDVLSLYKLKENDGKFSVEKSKVEGSFLDNKEFKQSFNELFEYYKDAKLVQISKNTNYLLVTFRIGKSVNDIKVYRWLFNNDGTLTYKDDNGNKEVILPPTHNFEWIATTRKNFVDGKYPHVSVLDKIFVETIGGDLTVKLENNTEEGSGIFNEPVNDANQSLEDAKIYYSEIGNLIILKILPYREDNYRYLVFNSLTENIERIDSIGDSCIELPEQHGIIFPNGYYLENGDFKVFNDESQNLKYFQTISSPNGEDYMYIFFDSVEGFYTIYSYNLIQKQLQNPIHAHGYSLFSDGKFLIFRVSENLEATKVHPMRIWQTPYVSDDFFASLESDNNNTYLSNIGNSELVRAISDLYAVNQYIQKDEVTTALYEGLIKITTKSADDYHWLSDKEVNVIKEDLDKIIITSELIIEEFEKVKSIQKQAKEVLLAAQKSQKELVSEAKLTDKSAIADNVQILARLKRQLGHLISVKEQRYIDLLKVEAMENEIIEVKDSVNQVLLNVLQYENSFDDYFNRIIKIENELNETEKVVEIEPLEENAEEINNDIDLINNEVNEIEVKDATVITKILDTVSEVFAKLNQLKSKIKNKKKSFLSTEAKAEFASQFKLLSQSVSSSISKADSPDKCDEELSRLMGQIESLESKFSDFDDYLTDIYEKREEVCGIFESHKQQLVNEVQKRTSNIEKAATITLNSVTKKAEAFDEIDKINSYFASDTMILKLYTMIKDIRKLGDVVKADDIESRLKKIKDQSLRSLRDNKDIFEDGGNIMKMGKHRFSVNKNNVELIMLPKEDGLYFHLTNTDFYEKVGNEELYSLKDYWDIDLISESKHIYRAEYLAYSVLNCAENNLEDLSLELLIQEQKNENGLMKLIQKYSSTRYKEGYVKGVHDYDAEKILAKTLKMHTEAGLLKFSSKVRSYALLSEALEDKIDYSSIEEYKKASLLALKLNNRSHLDKIYKKMADQYKNMGLELSDREYYDMSNYIQELKLLNNKKAKLNVEVTKEGYALYNDFRSFQTLINLEFDSKISLENFNNLRDWIESFVEKSDKPEWKFFVEEATLIYFIQGHKFFKVEEKGLNLTATIEDLLGDHSLIEDTKLVISLDDFMNRAKFQQDVVVPSYERYIEIKQEITEEQKEELQLEDFKAKPLASFVRNKLITDSYLHLIGDNLAKQIGTVGDSKRTDLMGMLLLISPPGYGKTTLIEYVANKLGLVFMKINCPSLNHEVVSLDPAEAPDATAAKELEKLNLGLEMGNNVMLYLDDIQHTNPEFLQKFISLCDGTRKIDGVWKGKPKTYDMKGKKFAVCMAGNPYTESGEAFKIPDMLANRADIYNLGDMLSDQGGVFELSYIENSLTSNSVLAPLANRSLDDLYKMIDMSKGKNIPINELEHNYQPAEVNEIKNVLKIMNQIQKIVSKVNQQYIKSASTEDKYRVEPSFRLQGSYRNMNKMTEKVIPVMNEQEVTSLILDHYKGESQTLTVGSEDNYLKLKTMMNVITEDEQARYDSILSDFKRNKTMGDADTDGTSKIANQLDLINSSFKEFANKENIIIEDDTEENNDVQNEILLKSLDNYHEISSKNNDQMLKAIRYMVNTIKQNAPNQEKDQKIIEMFTTFNAYLESKNKKD
jgi:hypothetical protein